MLEMVPLFYCLRLIVFMLPITYGPLNLLQHQQQKWEKEREEKRIFIIYWIHCKIELWAHSTVVIQMHSTRKIITLRWLFYVHFIFQNWLHDSTNMQNRDYLLILIITALMLNYQFQKFSFRCVHFVHCSNFFHCFSFFSCFTIDDGGSIIPLSHTFFFFFYSFNLLINVY